MVDDIYAACLEIAKRNNLFVMSSPCAARKSRFDSHSLNFSRLSSTETALNSETLQRIYTTESDSIDAD